MTKLFFVVDFKGENEEIFETLEEAKKYRKSHYSTTRKPSLLRVAMVKNYFQEPTGEWNYEDHSDTFDFLMEL